MREKVTELPFITTLHIFACFLEDDKGELLDTQALLEVGTCRNHFICNRHKYCVKERTRVIKSPSDFLSQLKMLSKNANASRNVCLNFK